MTLLFINCRYYRWYEEAVRYSLGWSGYLDCTRGKNDAGVRRGHLGQQGGVRHGRGDGVGSLGCGGDGHSASVDEKLANTNGLSLVAYRETRKVHDCFT